MTLLGAPRPPGADSSRHQITRRRQPPASAVGVADPAAHPCPGGTCTNSGPLLAAASARAYGMDTSRRPRRCAPPVLCMYVQPRMPMCSTCAGALLPSSVLYVEHAGPCWTRRGVWPRRAHDSDPPGQQATVGTVRGGTVAALVSNRRAAAARSSDPREGFAPGRPAPGAPGSRRYSRIRGDLKLHVLARFGPPGTVPMSKDVAMGLGVRPGRSTRWSST